MITSYEPSVLKKYSNEVLQGCVINAQHNIDACMSKMDVLDTPEVIAANDLYIKKFEAYIKAINEELESRKK